MIIIRYTIDKMLKIGDFREGLIFLMVLNMVSVLLCLNFKKIMIIKEEEEASTVWKCLKEAIAIKVFKKRDYVVWCIASFIGSFGILIPLLIMVNN
jgi:hypothetical protein